MAPPQGSYPHLRTPGPVGSWPLQVGRDLLNKLFPPAGAQTPLPPPPPGQWPSVPLPGQQPTRKPFPEAMDILERGHRNRPPMPTIPSIPQIQDMLKMRAAYPGNPIGNYPLRPGDIGTPPGYDPTFPASTVGATRGSSPELNRRRAGETITQDETIRFLDNVGRGISNLPPQNIRDLIYDHVPGAEMFPLPDMGSFRPGDVFGLPPAPVNPPPQSPPTLYDHPPWQNPFLPPPPQPGDVPPPLVRVRPR